MQKTASVFSVISFVTGLIMPVLFLIFFLSGMFNTEDYVFPHRFHRIGKLPVDGAGLGAGRARAKAPHEG